MANPIPCTQCDSGADSSWLLTARDDLTGLEPGTTIAVCAECWPTFIIGLATVMADAMAGGDDTGTDDSRSPAGGDQLAGSPGDAPPAGEHHQDGGGGSPPDAKSNGADTAPVAATSKGSKPKTQPATDD